jgi:hypothetical protein
VNAVDFVYRAALACILVIISREVLPAFCSSWCSVISVQPEMGFLQCRAYPIVAWKNTRYSSVQNFIEQGRILLNRGTHACMR